jgi:hypothetical protein
MNQLHLRNQSILITFVFYVICNLYKESNIPPLFFYMNEIPPGHVDDRTFNCLQKPMCIPKRWNPLKIHITARMFNLIF